MKLKANEAMMTPQPKILLKWQALEFDKREKTILWDVGVVFFAFLFALWGFIKGDVTLIAAALFGGIAFWMLGKKEPGVINFALREDGVQMGNLLYRYANMESFWILKDEDKTHELILRTHHFFNPLVHVNLGDEDTEKILKLVAASLPQKEEPHPLTHILAKLFNY